MLPSPGNLCACLQSYLPVGITPRGVAMGYGNPVIIPLPEHFCLLLTSALMWPYLLMGVLDSKNTLHSVYQLGFCGSCHWLSCCLSCFLYARCFHACLIHTSLIILITNPCGEWRVKSLKMWRSCVKKEHGVGREENVLNELKNFIVRIHPCILGEEVWKFENVFAQGQRKQNVWCRCQWLLNDGMHSQESPRNTCTACGSRILAE